MRANTKETKNLSERSPLSFTCFVVLLILFFFSMLTYSYTTEAMEPLAADLVQDGQKIDLQSAKYQQLFKELKEKYHFTQQQLDATFAGVTIQRRPLELMDKQWESKPYYLYRNLFINPKVIWTGKQKLIEYKDILDRIEKELGVDREVVVAIWGIETRYGTHLGSFNVFETLNTLFDAYPRRSKFFRGQLIHFLLLCRENGFDPKEIKGSYAGAFGQTQFIPSSFREYALSFDGDKKRDVFSSPADVLGSIANYLKHFHWQLDAPIYAELGTELHSQELLAAKKKGWRGRISRETVMQAQKVTLPPVPGKGQLSIVGLEKAPTDGGGFRYIAGYPNFQAITAWNHSSRYAMAVTELAEALK